MTLKLQWHVELAITHLGLLTAAAVARDTGVAASCCGVGGCTARPGVGTTWAGVGTVRSGVLRGVTVGVCWSAMCCGTAGTVAYITSYTFTQTTEARQSSTVLYSSDYKPKCDNDQLLRAFSVVDNYWLLCSIPRTLHICSKAWRIQPRHYIT